MSCTSLYHNQTVIWYDIVWYDMIWHDMIWCNMIWYDVIWYDIIWHDIIWFDMIWKYYGDIMLCYIILYHILLHYTIDF